MKPAAIHLGTRGEAKMPMPPAATFVRRASMTLGPALSRCERGNGLGQDHEAHGCHGSRRGTSHEHGNAKIKRMAMEKNACACGSRSNE